MGILVMKFNREMKVALGFIAFAVFYLIMTGQIVTHNMYSSSGVSSKSMPTIYGIVMIVLAVALFVTSLIRQKKDEAEEDKTADNKVEKKTITTVTLFGRVLPRKTVFLCISVLLFAFYAFAYTRLGFILSGIVYLGCMIMLLTPPEKKSVKMMVFGWIFAIVFIMVLYILFTKVLSMMLPRGILG